jgi:tryptophan halogenase
MSHNIRRVAIVGGGSVAWIAAAALRRAFRKQGLEVAVLDTGPASDAPAGWWTLPSQRGMHALLGVQENDFVRRTGATYKLGTEHRGWQGHDHQGKGSRFLHVHGDIGTDLGGTPFYKYLLREAIAGRTESAEEYSLAAVAARQGRFARPMGSDKDLTSSFTYGFHIDETAYSAFLREHAGKLGVRRVEAGIEGIALLGDGRVGAIRVAGGESVEAELFIDCSGADAWLMRQLPDAGREDWSAWLPCDRMISALAGPVADAAPVTRTLATDAGWLWQAPLAQASLAGYVYSSGFASDDAALARLRESAPGIQGSPAVTRLASGRRRQFWQHNCVALGSAAMQLEPLAGAGLHFAQLGLGTLIELLPLTAPSGIEAAEYNRVMAEHADALRDFTLAHYRAGNAPAGAFWSRARATAPPPRLAHKFELFAASGRINLLDFESFEEVDWAWLLLGAKVTPAALELQIRTLIESVTPQQVAPLRAYIDRLAASMPPHGEYIRRLPPQAPHAAKP